MRNSTLFMTSAPGDKVHSLSHLGGAPEIWRVISRAASSTLFPKRAKEPPGIKFCPIKTLAQIPENRGGRLCAFHATIKRGQDFRIIIIANEVSRRGNPEAHPKVTHVMHDGTCGGCNFWTRFREISSTIGSCAERCRRRTSGGSDSENDEVVLQSRCRQIFSP